MANKKSGIKKTFPSRNDFPHTVIGALADEFNKSIYTIERWITEKNDLLTSDRAKKVYSKMGFMWNPEWVLEGTAA